MRMNLDAASFETSPLLMAALGAVGVLIALTLLRLLRRIKRMIWTAAVLAAAGGAGRQGGEGMNPRARTLAASPRRLARQPGPVAALAFERAAMKLPIKTKVVARLGDTSHLEG